jgi:hypothetical protein
MLSMTSAAGPVRAEWSFTVPADRPASFDTTSNKIGWEITATLHYGQGRKDDSTFRLLVLPEFAPGVETR